MKNTSYFIHSKQGKIGELGTYLHYGQWMTCTGFELKYENSRWEGYNTSRYEYQYCLEKWNKMNKTIVVMWLWRS